MDKLSIVGKIRVKVSDLSVKDLMRAIDERVREVCIKLYTFYMFCTANTEREIIV